MPPEAQGVRPHTADEAHPGVALPGSKGDGGQHSAGIRRSDSSLFWRALALPYRGGVAPRSRDAAPAAPETAAAAAAAAAQALGRRSSLDTLGPSCSLGAEAPQPRLSDGRDSSGSEAAGPDGVGGGGSCSVSESCGAERQPQSGAPGDGQGDGKQRGRMRLNARGSAAALRSSNPIRKVVDAVGDAPDVPDKPLISLAIGDPTAYGLQAHSSANEALATAAQSGLFDGYALSSGLPACRAAVASAASSQLPVTQSGEPAVLPSDVFMTHGASQALALAFGAVANTSTDGPPVNVLLPRPGFPLYQTLCEYYGIQCRYYDLNPTANWEADPQQLVAIADANTVAVVICTPGNPTGCVWSTQHLRAVLSAAQDIGAVVIADEVYAGIVWAPKAVTTPVAALSLTVPVLSVGALSKRYLVPGWRCGWLVVHDRGRLLAKARIVEALHHLVQMSIGPTVPVQACVPHVLANTPRQWHDSMCALYAAAADTCAAAVASTPGLHIDCMPQGAMYLLVRLDLPCFDDSCNASDVAWAAALQREEAVVLLPGTAFGAPGRVRFVLCVTPSVLAAAWARITAFCKRHHTGSNGVA